MQSATMVRKIFTEFSSKLLDYKVRHLYVEQKQTVCGVVVMYFLNV